MSNHPLNNLSWPQTKDPGDLRWCLLLRIWYRCPQRC